MTHFYKKRKTWKTYLAKFVDHFNDEITFHGQQQR